ncbi:hypothetical protein BEK98_00900 [Streptomyces diastatochromogenes]|uniref:Uncharacterized protein n=1 Tax=Streptomyces diastatochromogenes TaxID=42236 RepID=A0A233SXD1_STRDA|nr:hypothetical protein BEK98_00900 [Streptomyces diastatochromogenes]
MRSGESRTTKPGCGRFRLAVYRARAPVKAAWMIERMPRLQALDLGVEGQVGLDLAPGGEQCLGVFLKGGQPLVEAADFGGESSALCGECGVPGGTVSAGRRMRPLQQSRRPEIGISQDPDQSRGCHIRRSASCLRCTTSRRRTC